jgi:hypothetical protein
MAAPTAAPNAFAPARMNSGFGWRIAVSILSVFGLLSFLLLYFAFWADRFTGLQDAVLVLVALLVFVAANGAAWASFGARYARPPVL